VRCRAIACHRTPRRRWPTHVIALNSMPSSISKKQMATYVLGGRTSKSPIKSEASQTR